MKETIDLTLNRDFGDKKTFSTETESRVMPWLFRNAGYKRDSEHQDNLFLTGSKEDRLYAKLIISMHNGTECERCGKDLTKLGWNRVYLLCGECNSALESGMYATEKKFPWYKYN